MEHVVHFFFAEFGEFTERFKSEKLVCTSSHRRITKHVVEVSNWTYFQIKRAF